MSDTKLKLEKVNITLDSKVVLDNVNLEVSDGDIVSLMLSLIHISEPTRR